MRDIDLEKAEQVSAVELKEERADRFTAAAAVSSKDQDLSFLSVIIPAKNEAECIASTVEHLYVELRLHKVVHEIVVVDDGSTDDT